jgi:MFS family permease
MPDIPYILRRQLGLPYPLEHRSNFFHLYMDIFWFGVLNGSILIFLAVYISRLGASPLQTGFLTAAPAIGNLIFSFPAGYFGQRRPSHLVTRWAWFANRLFYAPLIFLPVLFPPQTQISLVIVLVLLMTIPGAFAAVIGNAFFAETVPASWRGQVVGLRNALLAISTMFTSIIVGQILRILPFETGYQVVFFIGFAGSLLSCLHLFLIRPVDQITEPALKVPEKPNRNNIMRLEIISSPFRNVLLATLAVQIAVFMPNPIFPLYQVNILKLSDQVISLGSSLFWIVYFLASTLLTRFTSRIGFRQMAGMGMALTSISTLMFTLSFSNWIYAMTQIAGGIAWSMFGSGMINYVLERVPSHDRPAHMVWYNLAVNGAILFSGLVTPHITNVIGLPGGMVLAVIVRLFAGLAVLRWG